jgi:hypothetical protein
MIQLTIKYEESTGRIEVTGPIKNKILCYGLMELARESLSTYTPEKEKLINIANGAIPDVLKNGHPKP